MWCGCPLWHCCMALYVAMVCACMTSSDVYFQYLEGQSAGLNSEHIQLMFTLSLDHLSRWAILLTCRARR